MYHEMMTNTGISYFLSIKTHDTDIAHAVSYVVQE